MKHATQDPEGQTCERITPKPDRSEIVKVLHEHGCAAGFNLEWVVDRFPQQFAGRR